MSTARRPPAISGVSTAKATIIVAVYPSIASTVAGRILGQWLDSIPAKVGGIKLSHLLFGLPAALPAATLFLLLKAFGVVYVLTNRSVQFRSSRGNRLLREIPLNDIEQVVARQLPGQAFYPAADIELVGKSGDTLATLAGVLRADVFRQSILEARNARRQVEASLSTIKARTAAASA